MNFVRLVFCVALSGIASIAWATAAPTSLTPLPAQLDQADGSFQVDEKTPIVVADNDASTRHTADYLAELIGRTRGLHLHVTTGVATAGAIVLQRDPRATVANSEGYSLDVTPQGIRITARDDAGLFHGAITLWQLLTPDAQQGTVLMPALHIRDEPRFVWRGLMLDSVRHFQSVAEVEQLLDQMAQHKLNVFHWHLTDDQGWRIQIKRYPELTRIGAWRTPPDAGHEGEPATYGGFYTQDQIRQIVAYAAARYITVVPEIDMPGHAQAAVAAYPQIGVTGKRPSVSVDWGVNPYLYNADDATFGFVDNVLDEVMALFPSRYIHVGGDEAVKDQWHASPAVQAKMHALGVKDEDALQGWFIDRVGKYLASHGRRLIGWDEILDGGVQADAAVMSWRGSDGAVKAAQQGHDVVLSPAPGLYFDQLQSDRTDEIAGRIPVQDLASVYAFEPVPKELDAAQAKHVLGAQANVWTEHMPTMGHVEHAVFPRLDALSEVDWSAAKSRDWHGFLARLPAQFARYRAQGIGYADSAFAPEVGVDRNAALASGTAQVSLSDQVGAGALHYTLDGSVPDLHSPLYHAPFSAKLPVTVRAATFAVDGSLLASPHQRVVDQASLLSLGGNEMPNCPGSDFRLRVQPMPDATSLAPVYSINVFDSCQLYPATRMDGVVAIHVDAVRLERNYALAHDAKLVVSRPRSTPFGELVVHQDRCDGQVLATLPLPNPDQAGRSFALDASLPAQHGEHALCLIFTAPIDGPLYAMARIALLPTGTK
ncbi:family 20 glycosylhydrolase [Rhodanobacter sp. MP7CTX1]|uniref:beta-N-acetylhexosaminidase n=1 Tax=Rhodanobacter sp. MP7CTX1 TaxID=2723084 RepID=UPI00160ADF1B|nr:family 20 glycosylhydrolase [Rhodanobacter sp. MP7CTX1]MBB6188081.1 hexosaminidase [Rhodanobacter sp. MP7CTX1]